MAKQNRTFTSQLELIESFLHEKYIDDTKKLVERDKNVDMKRDIVCHPGISFLLYKLDQTQGDLFPYFKDIDGLKKFCDYLMFVEENENFYVILIELKKGLKSASKQLVAADHFSRFIIDSAKRISIEIMNPIKIYKVRISEDNTKNAYKNESRPKPLKINGNGIIDYDRKDAFRIIEIISILD